MQLEELMQYNADFVLVFEDGELQANSTILGLHSSVLRGAFEAASAAGLGTAPTAGGNVKNSSSNGKSASMPLAGITKGEWMEVAPYLYPVLPRPVIETWTQLEVLLRVASRLDIHLVLHAVDKDLLDSVKELEANLESEQCIWKWLRLADKAGLQQCLSALAKQAVKVDREACKVQGRLQDLSPHVLQLLVVACASLPPL